MSARMQGGEPGSGQESAAGSSSTGLKLVTVIVCTAAAVSVWLIVNGYLGAGLTVAVCGSLLAIAWAAVGTHQTEWKEALKPALFRPSHRWRDGEKDPFPTLGDREEWERWLHQERSGQVEMRASLRLWRVIWLIGAVVVWAALWWSDRVLFVDLSAIDVAFAGVLSFVFLLGFFFTRARLKEMNADVQATDYEILVLRMDDTRERTAASLFFKHQFDLRRYYDQNLRQNGQVFVLGTLCVLAGLATVAAAAAWIAFGENDEKTVQVTVGMLGAIGGLLSGGIATIFIRMHVGTGTALREFHRRLVATNRLHFANLLIAMVSSPRKRTALTADLVKAACNDGEGNQTEVESR
jgi:hypothetical protein